MNKGKKVKKVRKGRRGRKVDSLYDPRWRLTDERLRERRKLPRERTQADSPHVAWIVSRTGAGGHNRAYPGPANGANRRRTVRERAGGAESRDRGTRGPSGKG